MPRLHQASEELGAPGSAPSADPGMAGPVGVGVALVLAQGLRFAGPDHAIDDAWISFRIARNWVEHGVPSFNLDGPPVEGMTNLLWTGMSAGWIGLLPDLDPVVIARLLGLLLHVATLVLGVRLVGRRAAAAGGSARAAGLAAAVMIGASGSMAYWSMSGLETSLWTLLAVLALDRLDRRRFPAAGGALGALAATRPEGVLAGALLSLAAVARDRGRGWATPLVFGVGVAAVELFRWTTYGSLVPNTFYAKSPDPGAGLHYLGRAVLYGTGGLGLLTVAPALRGGRVRGWLLVAAIMAAGAAWSGGDWMPGFRRVSLPLLFVALAGGVGVGVGARAGGWRRWVWRIGLVAWVGGNGLAAWRGLDSASFPHETMAELGERAAATPGIESVALVDIGRFGWAFPGHIVDLVGLVDAERAHQPGGHADKPWDEEWFRRQDPDLLVARSETPIVDPLPTPPRLGRPEVGMVRSVLDNGGYHLHTVVHPAAGQWLMIFAADDLELPEALWGPRWSKGLRELLEEAAR